MVVGCRIVDDLDTLDVRKHVTAGRQINPVVAVVAGDVVEQSQHVIGPLGASEIAAIDVPLSAGKIANNISKRPSATKSLDQF